MQPKNTNLIGKVLLHFDELPSTNAHALNLCAKNRPREGTVVLADHQSDGRGQIGSKWVVEAGQNLTFSVILYPNFLAARDQFYLNQAISLAVKDFVQSKVEQQVFIKWPNDIYIEDRKTCGLLIQNTISGKQLQTSIVGIGINVNQDRFAPELIKATSLKLESGAHFILPDLSAQLFALLEHYYLLLKAGGIDELNEAYQAALYRFREWAMYQRPDGSLFKAQLLGVNPRGQLLLQHQGIEAFNLKEVSFL